MNGCGIGGCNHPEGECLGMCLNKKQEMKRRQILEDAIKCVCHDRQDQHGAPENTFAMISDLWEIYLSHKHNLCVPLHPTDVAQMMVLFKIARSALGKLKDDDFVDEAGYAALAGELANTKR